MQAESVYSCQEEVKKPAWPHAVGTCTGTFVGVTIWLLVFDSSFAGLLIAAAIATVIELILAFVLSSFAQPTPRDVAYFQPQAEVPTEPLLTAQVLPASGPPLDLPVAKPFPVDQPRNVVSPSPPSAEPLHPVEAIVQKYVPRIRDKQIFFAPNIPPQKLHNVLTSYAVQARSEKVLMLVDNTTFGNSKDGFLLTTTKIYSHNILEAPQAVPLDAIEDYQWNEGVLNSQLAINGTKFYENNFASKESMRKVVLMLGEIRALYRPDPAQQGGQEKSVLETLRELRQLVADGILSEEDFEGKKKELLARV